MFNFLPELHVLRHVDFAVAVVLSYDNIAACAEQPVILVLLDTKLYKPIVFVKGTQCLEPSVTILAFTLNTRKGTLERLCRHYLRSGVMKFNILR